MQTEAQKRATKKYRLNNKKKVAGQQAKWRAENPDKVKELRKKYRSDPEKKKKELEYNKKWIKKNPEKRKAQTKRYLEKHEDDRIEYRKKNSAKRSAYSKKWNKENEGKHKVYMTLYQKLNPEKWSEVQQNRRAIIRQSSKEERKAIRLWMKDWKSKELVTCEWCKLELHPSGCHSDHVEALMLGGKHELKNLVIACQSCNRKKGRQTIQAWLKSQEEFNQIKDSEPLT